MKVFLLRVLATLIMLKVASADAATSCAETSCASYGGVKSCSTAGVYQCTDGQHVAIHYGQQSIVECACRPPPPAKQIVPVRNASPLKGGRYIFKGGPGTRRTRLFILTPHLTRLKVEFQHNQTKDTPFFQIRLINPRDRNGDFITGTTGGATFSYNGTYTNDEFLQPIFLKHKGGRYLKIRATGTWKVWIN